MKNQLYCQLLLFFLFVLGVTESINAQWPQWRGVNRDGICTEENLLKEWPVSGPRRIWAVNSVGDGFTSAIVGENTVFTVGKIDSLEYLTAIDFTGKVLWQQAFGRAHKGEWPESRCTPTYYKNKLYAFTGYGDFACLDSKTGSILWRFNSTEKFGAVGNPEFAFCESPLVVEDKVILTTAGNQTTLVALNYLNGETVWKSESLSDTCDYVSPVFIEYKDKKIIFAGTRKYFFAADLSTGKIFFKTNSLPGIIPTLVNKTSIYCNDGQRGKLFSYNPDNNDFSFTWCDSVPGSYMGGAVAIGDQIFGTNRNAAMGFHCIDRNTGKLVFSNKTIKESSLIATKDRIYSYDGNNGKVYLLKPNGTNVDVAGSFRVTIGSGPCLAHMSIAKGMLFIRHGKVLMAYDIRQS